jgi:hypothetical protein
MVEIIFDKELDKEVYLDFADFSVAGADFGARIRRDHPGISEENHSSYIDEYYDTNRSALERSTDELRGKLEETQHDFYTAAQSVFGTDYSDVKVTGALSIFDCNPRYPEKDVFQVYYQRDTLGKIEVAYHETMHFLFFRYCADQCADLIHGYDQNNGPYWELSEIFNVVILNQPAFRSILKREEQMFYPHLEGKLLLAKQIWLEGNSSVRYFVEQMLALKE